MLRHLSIKNYALIDGLEIDFPAGLTIITGETGAGKSILIGALELLLGNRADSQALQDKSRKCVVEGTFDIRAYGLQELFAASDLDYAGETNIRREINPEGKSRAFVNDTPVTLSVLKEIGLHLVDIHSQHETLTLNDSRFQLGVVDAFAENAALLVQYSAAYKSWRKLLLALNELKEREAQAKKDLDYFRFQFDELDSAQLKSGEQAEAETELETLEHAEAIKSGLSKSAWALDGGEENLLASLNEIRAQISAIAKFNPAIAQLQERLNSTHIELKDLSREIESLEGEITHDAGRIEFLQGRLDTIYRLQQKHGVKTVEELIAHRDDLSNKLIDITSLDDQITAAEKETNSAFAKLSDLAAQLSKKRKAAAPGIGKTVGDLLNELGMPNASLQVNISAIDQPSETGTDRVQFLFSANKGSDAKPLDKVASGGELSRLMLSLKALITKLTALPTIIFDEIDTGISGDIAAKAGLIMEKMAGTMQVLTITHLPQVASRGASHIFVFKEEEQGRTVTRLRRLSKEERVQEIAKMLSAGKVSDAAVKNAKELLKA